MEKGRLNREIWGVVICLAALLITISLFSYDPRDRSFNTPSGAMETQNWGGFLGAYLADTLLQALGFSAYLLPLFLCIFAVQLFRAHYRRVSFSRTLGCALLLIGVALILSLLIDFGKSQ